MKALAKRVFDIEQSVAQRTEKKSDAYMGDISAELDRRVAEAFRDVHIPVERDDTLEVSVPSIPAQDERPDVAEQHSTDTPIPDVLLPSEQAGVEIRQEDNRVSITFTISPDDLERIKNSAKERGVTEEELLRQFAENTDLFVDIPPKTAAYIRRAAKGQRRSAHRLVDKVLRQGFIPL